MVTVLKLSACLVIFVIAARSFAQDGPPLSIISFSWSRYVDALNAEPEWQSGRPTRTQQIDDRERLAIERGYGDLLRSRELRKIEHEAKRSSVKEIDLFLYKIKVRNTDARTIKYVYLEYQIIDPANPNSASRRQFFCDQKIKTNRLAVFEVLSAVPPLARTVSVKAAGAPKYTFEEKVVINRIEYSDDSVWQRDGWDFPNPAAAALPSYKRARFEPPCMTF